MGKNIKSYATTQVHSPQEREGSLMAKSPNLSAKIRLNRTHSFLKLQAKVFKFTLYANSAQFAHIVCELREIRTIYLHYVSGTCPGRELSEIPANYANSAQFAHILRELREIRTIY